MKIRLPYLLAALVAMVAIANVGAEKGLNAAADLTLTTLDGESVDIREPKSRLLLVNFWSTSCSICVRELPALKAIDNRYDDADLTIVGISRPYDEPGAVLSHVKEREIEHPIVQDQDGSIAAAFPGVRFTPTSFLLDSTGRIVWQTVGQIDQRKLISAIEQHVTVVAERSRSHDFATLK